MNNDVKNLAALDNENSSAAAKKHASPQTARSPDNPNRSNTQSRRRRYSGNQYRKPHSNSTGTSAESSAALPDQSQSVKNGDLRNSGNRQHGNPVNPNGSENSQKRDGSPNPSAQNKKSSSVSGNSQKRDGSPNPSAQNKKNSSVSGNSQKRDNSAKTSAQKNMTKPEKFSADSAQPKSRFDKSTQPADEKDVPTILNSLADSDKDFEENDIIITETAVSADNTPDDSSEKIGEHTKKRRSALFIAVPIVTAVIILTAGVVVSANALGIFDTPKHEAFVATEQSNKSLTEPQGKFLAGISVQGIDLGGKTMKQAKEMLSSQEAQLIPSINYTVKCGEKVVRLTQDDFTFHFDTVKVLNEAYEYSEYMRQVIMDKGRATLKRSEKKDYPISISLPEASIKTACEKLAEKVNVQVQDAHVTKINTKKEYLPDMFSFEEGSTGYLVDVQNLVNQISALRKNDTEQAEINGKMEVIEPKVGLEDLLKNLVLISRYETYSGNTWAGNMNMATAMESMTGSIIKPGEVFSFNGKTGDSNLVENGYYSAGVIVNGRAADGVGGGICQAATTIYNAAIRAGMTVVEREPHTWPSDYVPVGIDSAIDYGAIDMKFRNDTEHEVYLICYMDGGTLHAFIYGYKPSDFDEICVSSWFTGGSGIGFGAGASRSYYKNGKVVKTEDLPDSFYSNGGGTSYAYDEPLENYKYERVYTDKQAKKLAAKIEEAAKTKTDKAKSKSSDTDNLLLQDNANLMGVSTAMDFVKKADEEPEEESSEPVNAVIDTPADNVEEETVIEEDVSEDVTEAESDEKEADDEETEENEE